MDKLTEMMVSAGWERVCDAVRKAGRKCIIEAGGKRTLAATLRRLAKRLDPQGEKGSEVDGQQES